MEIFLLIWFVVGSLAFLAYVTYDLNVSDARKAERAALGSLQLLYRQINRWDWQQAVANIIASLKTAGSGVLPVVMLPEPRHSFPRQMVRSRNDSPHVLLEKDLYDAVEEYRLKTNRTEVGIWLEIQEQVKSFLDTRDSLRAPRNIQASVSGDMELRADLREKLQEVRSKYSFFNASEPLHEQQLKRIFDGEGIDVHYIEDLPLLSFFVEYTEDGKKRQAVIIRKDDVHQALKEFLLGHELGHWFLHFDSGFAERLIGENYYLHSSLEWQPLETDADTFAMTALFPTPYLADFENNGFCASCTRERLCFTSLGSNRPMRVRVDGLQSTRFQSCAAPIMPAQ